ncbi:MAG: 16S rRNA (guanine(527)-N(7))-methyltransferase RsmG [Bacilli bacterium]|nr:16S rRNA (guanine(527)-N(7))-methyltransferase RsmG [Bacilli bacterium]
MNKEMFKNEIKKFNIKIDQKQENQLEIYKEELKKWNKKTNLTTIIDDEGIYLKHFYDSICIKKAIDINNKNICDFGTGAGFPGLVLAIIFNKATVTLLESNGKKIEFLKHIVNVLDLKNVKIIKDRAEIYGKSNRELFDIVTCRAVSNLNIILELSIALLKINGCFIPLKSNVEEELKNSEKKYKMLGYNLENKIEYELPIEKSKRTILVFKKVKKTEKKYPRNYNLIKNEIIK